MLVAAISLSAFATSAFNTAVFNDGQDITVEKDTIEDTTFVYTTSLSGAKGIIPIGRRENVGIYGFVSITDNFDIHKIAINYYADDWAFIDEIIVKIGGTRYYFTDFDVNRKVRANATIIEKMDIVVKNSTIPFMQDLIENRDEEVRVRLCGRKKNIEFVLTDDIKNSIINLYNLFVAGGGTQPENMDIIEIADETRVKVVK